MSDSILAESPARNGPGNGYHPASLLGSSPYRNDGVGRGTRGETHRIPPQSIYYSNDGDSRSSGRRRHPAGESSAPSYAINGGNESPSSSSPTGSLTQNAGEPSEGDRPKPNGSIFRENDKSFPEAPEAEVGFDMRGQRNQSKKGTPAKTLQFKTDERFEKDKKDSSVNKSFSISDWSAVGNTASLLQDWSDSHSTSSYAESSYAESCSSLEATTRASALDSPRTCTGPSMQFSIAVMCGNKLKCWKHIPISLRRARRCFSLAGINLPPFSMWVSGLPST